jgi:3',5'-cyclic AMP phosphodiesterase CpdA
MMKKFKIIFIIFFIFWEIFSTSYSFTFAVIGDRAGRPVKGVFERNFSEILKRKPDFIIQLGDILDNSSEEEYEFLRNLIKGVKIPIYFVPGNHDLKGDPKGEKFQSFTGRPLYYYFDYENSRFIILNNSSGKIGKEQMNWLINILKNNDKKYKFVFMHQPIISPSFFFLFHKADPFESKELMRIFEEYKVNYVFSGHIHMYYRKVINGVIYIISGIGGARPYVSTQIDEGKPHFILLEVTDMGIKEEVIRFSW